MLLKNKDGYYVHKLHGVLYVSWVRDIRDALHFPKNHINWHRIVSDMVVETLIAVAHIKK